MNWKFAGQAFFAGSSRSFRFKSSDSRSFSPLTGSESVAFSTCSNASLLASRYEVGRDVFSSVMRFFESPTLRSRSSDSRRSLLLAGSDSVAFSCSKAFSLGSRSGTIAICTNLDGLHRIIYADWLKKSPHIFKRHIVFYGNFSGTGLPQNRVDVAPSFSTNCLYGGRNRRQFAF
jgi:hypothetical protein